MSHPACPQLLATLTDERQAVRSFVELLQHEQELLTENSIDPLLTLAEQKTARAVALNSLVEARQRLLLSHTPGLTTPALIQPWIEANCRDCLPVWLEVRTLADQARQINLVNGELIQMKLRHNQQVLTALSRAVSQANLYGPTGQSSFSAGSGRSLGNV